ncbi:MAG: DHH family phosphoesterase [Nanoarchaeota archaeon]
MGIINSEKFDAMYDSLKNAADEIGRAVHDKRPVWIRHHNDCDGYCGALALEKAILTLLSDFHIKESDVFFYYKRFPTKTPFYDYSDATRDLSLCLAEGERFNRKRPLLIIVDNGSSKEDIFALKKLEVFGIEVVVIDHHPPVPEVKPLLKAHVNPHLYGFGSGITASMLCAELAFCIDETTQDIEILGVLGAIADKSEEKELNSYMELAFKKGYSREYLQVLAEVIDFEAGQLANLEGRQFVQELLFNYDKQKEIVDIVKGELEQEKTKILKVIQEYVVYEDFWDYLLGVIDAENYFSLRKLFYTKITNLAKEFLEKKTNKPVVMVGYCDDIATIRISKNLGFDVNKLINELREKFPYAMVQGGGHAKAGSIHFAKHAKENIIEEIKKYLRKKDV